jgi:two-component system, OmpR family, phosphate regulon sensor histidine kinase PhoR
MKRRNIQYIFGLMLAAVTGLIAIQIYWTVNLIKTEEERFNRTVSDAMFDAVRRLERNEAVSTISRKVSGGKEDLLVFVKEDSNTFRWEVSDSAAPGNHVNIRSIPRRSPNHIELKADSFEIKVTTGRPGSKFSFEPNYKRKKLLDTLIHKKKILVKDVVTEMVRINPSKPINERIKKRELDKVLKDEFSKRGIDLQFGFGVKKESSPNFLIIKEKKDSAQLADSRHITLLFPDEFFQEPNQLAVFFPQKNQYLLGKILYLLALALILIMVIVVLFYRSVQMYLKQKKLTDVKNDLINNITHEFKTPLSTISLACEALNEPELINNSSSVTKYSEIIKEENSRLQTMVESILNAAVMEKDTFEIQFERVDAHELISRCANKFSGNTDKNKCFIEFDLRADAHFIMGDSFHLYNVFTNLLDNAVKYCSASPRIKIESSSIGGTLTIKVSDNGIGIPKELHQKIFESFYRVPTGNIHNVRGNGIGLSYVKKIINTHKGTITVESGAGSGSIFIITLPAVI